MGTPPPSGALWQAVQARRPDLWPADDEDTATDLATALAGIGDSAQQMREGTTRGSQLSNTAWTDTAGGALRDGLGRHTSMTEELAAHVHQRAAGAQTYATELSGAKTEITTTVAANEPVFAAMSVLPGGLGPMMQNAFAATVADHLGASMDLRAARIAQIPFPMPPSNDEIRAKYQVPDDPNGMTTFFGLKVTATEAQLLDNLWPWQLLWAKQDHDKAIDGGHTIFPDQGREGDQDNHRDAYRHAYWNALMAKDLGAGKAQELGTAHEGNPDENPDGKDPARESMDLYNNEVGRQIAAENPELSDEELGRKVEEAVRGGRMVVMDDNGNLVPSNSIDF